MNGIFYVHIAMPLTAYASNDNACFLNPFLVQYGVRGRGGMVDTLVLEANAERCEGSSPFARTKRTTVPYKGRELLL